MFAFKSSFVSTFLVIIYTIYYVFATLPVESCKKLIKKEYYFQELLDEDIGLQHFINAFKYLSYNTIADKFNKPTNRRETNSEKLERTVSKLLTRAYFEDLIYDHQIDVSDKQDPYTWCTAKTNNPAADNDLAIALEVQKNVTNCLDAVLRLLRVEMHGLRYQYMKMVNDQDINDFDKPETMFQRLYEDWTLDSLSELENEDTTVDNHVNLENFTYARQYFHYYLEVVENLNPGNGNFRSIQQFCEEDGQHYILQYRYDLS